MIVKWVEAVMLLFLCGAVGSFVKEVRDSWEYHRDFMERMNPFRQ